MSFEVCFGSDDDDEACVLKDYAMLQSSMSQVAANLNSEVQIRWVWEW